MFNGIQILINILQDFRYMEHFKSRTTVIKRLGMLRAHLTAARTGDDIYKNVLPKDLINEELKASISHFEQKHQDNILKAKHKFLDYQQMIMKPGWKLEKEIKYKGGSGKLWSNSDKKSGLNAILREIEVNVPHKPACDFFKDEIRFSKLNENLKETKIVEDLKNESSYIYH